MTLNSRTIAKARQGETHYDEVVTGLHLRCFPGRKSFYLYYRTKEGRPRRPKIGDLGILTLEQARNAARSMLAEIAIGGDPVADRQDARRAPALSDLCDRYIKEHASHKKSLSEDRRLIDVFIRPKALAHRKVKEVAYEDMAALHEALRTTPVQANRLLALCSKMFNLAEKWKLRDPYTNPCRHVTRFAERKRKRTMTGEEAPRIAAAIAKYEAARPQAAAFLYLLIVSGARPSEIANAQPGQIQKLPVGGKLVLTVHKTDGTGEDRVVYLPPQAMALLERLPPGENGTITGIKSPKSLWEIVRREAECADLRMYPDLRKTFASAALKAGYTLDQVGELLGHLSTQTTKRYAFLLDDGAQQAAAATATILDQMMRHPALKRP